MNSLRHFMLKANFRLSLFSLSTHLINALVAVNDKFIRPYGIMMEFTNKENTFKQKGKTTKFPEEL